MWLYLSENQRLRWRIFNIWSPRWRLGARHGSFSKDELQLPDLFHVSVDPQQRGHKKGLALNSSGKTASSEREVSRWP